MGAYYAGWQGDWQCDILPRLGRQKDILYLKFIINSDMLD